MCADTRLSTGGCCFKSHLGFSAGDNLFLSQGLKEPSPRDLLDGCEHLAAFAAFSWWDTAVPIIYRQNRVVGAAGTGHCSRAAEDMLKVALEMKKLLSSQQ